jgi:REP element-mobilizing transposase RayT
MKRKKRITFDETAHYHVMSRIAERRFYLGPHEKEMFRNMMWRVAAFSSVKILTYCIMDNHFHLLIEVPKRQSLSLEEVKGRLPLIYRGEDLAEILAEIRYWEKMGSQPMLDAIKHRYEKRMFDLSHFMKTLKQRFSIWYNRNHDDRRGTLWEDRFKSVVVESPQRREGDMGNRAILTMAAYIELNPVRAQIVDDPADYRWCGYGEASGGVHKARAGIGFLVGYLAAETVPWEKASKQYRTYLFMRGYHKGHVRREHLQRVLDQGGRLTPRELLHCRVRYFSDGVVFGSHRFVEEVFQQKRGCFHEDRRTGARHMHGGKWGDLYTARDLQRKVITVPS